MDVYNINYVYRIKNINLGCSVNLKEKSCFYSTCSLFGNVVMTTPVQLMVTTASVLKFTFIVHNFFKILFFTISPLVSYFTHSPDNTLCLPHYTLCWRCFSFVKCFAETYCSATLCRQKCRWYLFHVWN